MKINIFFRIEKLHCRARPGKISLHPMTRVRLGYWMDSPYLKDAVGEYTAPYYMRWPPSGSGGGGRPEGGRWSGRGGSALGAAIARSAEIVAAGGAVARHVLAMEVMRENSDQWQ
jgi:hypothetical protein